MEYNKKRNKYGELVVKKSKNGYSEKFAIPIVPDSIQQRQIKYRENCNHDKWKKVYSDKQHWCKICLDSNCSMQFESEVTEPTAGKEIFI